MNYRFLLVALLLPSAAIAQQSDAPKQSCTAFMQGFYDWYAPKASAKHAFSAWKLALDQRPQALSPVLRKELRADLEEQRRSHEIVGLDFDPLLGSQDPSAHYKVRNVTLDARTHTCRADLYAAGHDAPDQPSVTPEAALANGHWQFVNFHYGRSEYSSDENLLTTLDMLQTNRQQFRK